MMFTGKIEQLGKVISFEERRGQKKLRIQSAWENIKAGEKISVNGASLTTADSSTNGELLFHVDEKTFEKTTLGKLEAGFHVNLEKPLLLNGSMIGHWVQGEVDAKALVLNLSESADPKKLTIALNSEYGRFCVEKCPITINGTSLIIHSLIKTKLNEFMITFLLSPEVWKNTSLQDLKFGDEVNVEVDILAKYMEHIYPTLLEKVSPIEMATEIAKKAETEFPIEENSVSEFSNFETTDYCLGALEIPGGTFTPPPPNPIG